MKRFMVCFLYSAVISALCFSGLFAATEPDSNVEGTLTVNDETIVLSHAYVFQQDDEVVVFLSDSEVNPDSVPFDLGDLAYEEKLRGLSFGVLKGSDEVNPESWHNAIYHKVWLGRGALIEFGELSIQRFDTEVLQGTIKTVKPSSIFEHSYSYDAGFTVTLAPAEASRQQKPVETVITGADTPAAEAYAAYYRAKLSGDLDEVKEMVIAKNIKDLEGPMGNKIIELWMMTSPRKISIKELSASFNEVTLAIGGVDPQGTYSVGDVKMLLQDDKWKVARDKWSIGNEQ